MDYGGRWLERKILNLDENVVALHLHRKALYRRKGGEMGGLSGTDIKLTAVLRAGDTVVLLFAFTEGCLGMGTQVFQSKDFVANAK